MGTKLVLVLLFVALANAASFSFSGIGATNVGEWSDYVFVTASDVPEAAVTITISEVTTTNLELSTTSLHFDQQTQGASFRIRTYEHGNWQLSFTLSSAIQFSPPGDQYYAFNLRSIDLSNSFPAGVYIDFPSEPVRLSISTPSTSDLTFTPTVAEPSITFNPSSIVIPAGSLSATFTFIGSKELSENLLASWSITGEEAKYYEDSISDTYHFYFAKRYVVGPSYSGKDVLGANSNTLYFQAVQIPNGTLTITPQAADTIFTPESVTLTSTEKVVSFTYNSSTPEEYKPVFYYLSGDSAAIYNDIETGVIGIPKRTVNVEIAEALTLTSTTHLSISLTAPVLNDVTVSFFANRLIFNPSTVTFTGLQTSVSVAVTPVNQGTATISFLISGTDADLYNDIDDATVSIGRGGFTVGNDNWYVPDLWVGQESDKIPIRVNFAPKTDVSLTLSAPDVVFTPAKLTFKAGQEQQFFTITPQHTSHDASGDYTSSQVSFLISGTDHTWFSAPDPLTIKIQRRTIQTKWSAHLENSGVRYLQKPYEVWASASYVGKSDRVTVTPVSPYFKFSPAVLTFTSGTTRVKFTATPTGVYGDTAVINYIIGGTHGGYYDPIPALETATAIRPLFIKSAVLAPDTRVPGVWFDDVTDNELGTYHTYSIYIYSNVLPESSLVITPKSPHIQFTPSSVTVNGGDFDLALETTHYIRTVRFYPPARVINATFKLNALATGVHDVYFSLSGGDANYYDVPNHVKIMMNTELRTRAESGASMVVPSVLSLFIFAIVFFF